MISRGFFFSGVGNIELSTRRQTFIQRRYCKIFSEPGEIAPGLELRERLVRDVETTATSK